MTLIDPPPPSCQSYALIGPPTAAVSATRLDHPIPPRERLLPSPPQALRPHIHRSSSSYHSAASTSSQTLRLAIPRSKPRSETPSKLTTDTPNIKHRAHTDNAKWYVWSVHQIRISARRTSSGSPQHHDGSGNDTGKSTACSILFRGRWTNHLS